MNWLNLPCYAHSFQTLLWKLERLVHKAAKALERWDIAAILGRMDCEAAVLPGDGAGDTADTADKELLEDKVVASSYTALGAFQDIGRFLRKERLRKALHLA
jgi:hypothetical protein